MLIEQRHTLIMWTVRQGDLLQEAVDWCKERGVEFYAVNKNFPEENIDNNGCYCKINADLFIDDRNIGGLPDWGKIYQMITENKTWDEVYRGSEKEKQLPQKKKKWYQW